MAATPEVSPASPASPATPAPSSGLIKARKVVFSKCFGTGNGAVCLREFAGIDCDGSVIVEGFPSISLTAILSAGYLVDQLNLPLIGFMSSTDFPPKCIIDKGQPSHPIRIFGNRKITVILCEFKLPSNESTYNVVEAILDFAYRHSCKMLLTVEGLPVETPIEKMGADYDRLRFISSSEAFNEVMTKRGYTAVDEGVIAGVTGLILAEGPLHDVDVGCLLAPTSAAYPDARSSVNIVKALSAFLADVEIDTAPLEEKAAALERSVKGVLREAARPQTQMFS